MKTLEKVSDFVGKYMAAIVIVVAALALFFPGTFSVVKTAWVNTLLGIVMFGMGLTLKPEDFKVVLVPIALGFVVNHFFHAFTLTMDRNMFKMCIRDKEY